jgi:hypothetical protein
MDRISFLTKASQKSPTPTTPNRPMMYPDRTGVVATTVPVSSSAGEHFSIVQALPGVRQKTGLAGKQQAGDARLET